MPPPARPSWGERIRSWWQPPDQPGINRLALTRERLAQWYADTALGTWLAHWQDRLAYRTADEAVQFWQSLFRWQTILKITLGLGLLLAAAVVTVHFGRHWYRQHQERQLTQQADALLAQGAYRQAFFRAQMGLRLNPDNPALLRVVASVMAKAGNTNALFWARRVLQLNPDFTNQLALATLALQVETAPFPTAAQTLHEVAPARQQTPEFQRLAGMLAVRSGQLQAAADHFTQLVRLDPANGTNHLQLAALQLLSTNAADQQTGIASLQRLATQPQTRLEALRLLVAQGTEQNNWAGAEPFARQLAALPEASMADHLGLLTLLQSRHNPDFSNHLAQAEALAETNYAALLQLATWMNTHNCPRQTLDWLARLPASLVQQGALPATAAEAYASLGAWPEMEMYLLRTNWPALEPFRQAYLAHAADQLGNTMEGDNAWVIAIRLATPSVTTLRVLEQMTRAWNWPERQEDLLWLTAQRYPDQNWAWSSLTQLVQKKQDTRRMWRLAKLQYEQHPEDDHRANDYAAYALLVNEDLDSARDLASAIHQRHPEDAIMTTTYALAKLKVGDTNAALAAFQKLSPELLHTPIVAAYYGIVLAICGDQDQARIYLDQSAPARLLPEETALVSQARNHPRQLTQELVPPTTTPPLFAASQAHPPKGSKPSPATNNPTLPEEVKRGQPPAK